MTQRRFPFILTKTIVLIQTKTMNNLKQIIEEKGIKQAYLAKQINVSKQTITNWIKGYSQPDIKQAQKIKEILNLKSIDELLEKKAS